MLPPNVKYWPFNRAARICFLVLGSIFCFAPFAPGQTSSWDSGVSKDLFKEDLTPKEPKNPKKVQKPTRRLAPQSCDDCQKIVDKLQAALDDWYALELADANALISKSVTGEQTDVSQADARAQKEDALTGLGQKERPPPKGKNKSDAKKEIKKLSDELQECLKKCGPGKETKTPTPTPTPEQPGDDTGKNKIPVPPAFDIQIPPLPPCFDSERDRQAHRKKLEELQTKLGYLKKQYGEWLAEPPNNGWKEYREKLKKAFDDINDQSFPGDDGKDKIDKVPVPCEKKPGGGGKGTGPGKGKPKKPRTTTGHNVSFEGGPTDDFCALISDHKINIDISGTGETIGHVADAVIENLTDEPIECSIPAMVLESRSGKNQHYACPRGETVEIPPYGTKKVPLNGVCLARNRPPVGNGVTGDLAINDCDPDAHIPREKADLMRRIGESKYDAADKLEKDGDLKDIPYQDPKKRKDIVVQWSTWMDPRISDITGAPPATKDDLKKVVYKQLEEQGSVTPDKKKKVDEAIDTIFDKIELTTEKAKDLEKDETGAQPGTNDTYEVDDKGQPSAAKTLEKLAKKNPKLKDWLDKRKAAILAKQKVQGAVDNRESALTKYAQKNKTYQTAEAAVNSLKSVEKPTPEDKEKLKQAVGELKKLRDEYAKDFDKTDEGKQLKKELGEAQKASDAAGSAEHDAGKGVGDDLKKFAGELQDQAIKEEQD